MKLEKDAVTVCGFVAIFMLLILIIAPPLLRVLFGSENMNNSNSLLSDVYERLECVKKENYTSYNLNRTITTVYKNNEVSKLTFLYEVLFLNNNSNYNNLANIYIDEYSILKQVSNASVIEGNNSFTVELDYVKNAYKYDQFLSKYSASINEQREYYVNNGYICNVIK